MKRVLFISLSYPNFSSSASVLCTKRLIDCMAKSSEFEVHCLCTKLSDEGNEEIIDNVMVHRINKTIFKKIIDSCYKYSMIQDTLIKIQKILTFPLFPCRDPFMLRRYKQKAKNLYKKHQYDIVIAEHHGYNTLMTGYILKQLFPSIKFYPVLWDPILGQTKPNFLPERFVDIRIEDCENKINYSADKIFSIKAAQGIYSHNNMDSAKDKRIYFDIPGILPPEPEVSTKYLSLIKTGYINITYSGLLGKPSRDPEYIIDILNKTSFVKKVNIIFLSKGLSDKEKNNLKQKFKGNIMFHHYIPITELHTLYKHSDYLLNISHSNANMTPSKIFEYMSYGKPIISTFITENDAAKQYLDLYPEAIVIDQNTNKLDNIKKLEKFMSQTHEFVEFKKVKTLFPLNTPDTFVKIITNL